MINGVAGKTVTPKDINELTKLLGSKDQLVIVLDKVFDYTESEGWATGKGCFFQKCGAGFQQSLAHAGTCNGRPPTQVKSGDLGLHLTYFRNSERYNYLAER